MTSELRLVVGVAKAKRLHVPGTWLVWWKSDKSLLHPMPNRVRFWMTEWLDPITERVLLKRLQLLCAVWD